MSGIHNYHTHTIRCKHAQNTDEEYVQKAIEYGFEVLGFSDHTPWPQSFESKVRMRPEELGDYVASIRALGEKYRDKIKLYLGLECEYYPEYYPWLKEQVQQYGLNYLILGNHFVRQDENDCHYSFTRTAEKLRSYVDTTVRAMETGMFAYLAHPDVVLASYPQFDENARAAAKDLCRAALDLDFPMEYNLLGMVYHDQNRYDGLGYPCLKFWEVAGSMGCKGIVGFDAHAAAHLERVDRYAEGRKILASMGVRMLDSLPGLDKDDP